jgi:hypothetical protein
MTCRTLVHELGCEQPRTTKELLDIATWHASGEEAIGDTFVLDNAGTAAGDGWVPIKSARKGREGQIEGAEAPTMLPCYND